MCIFRCSRIYVSNIYRPQRSCGQGNIFTPVCHSVHTGGSASVHAGIPTPPGTNPPGSRHPPRSRPPQEQTHTPPPREQTPWSRHPPPWEADSSIWSMSSRYASYWNAFLFRCMFLHLSVILFCWGMYLSMQWAGKGGLCPGGGVVCVQGE